MNLRDLPIGLLVLAAALWLLAVTEPSRVTQLGSRPTPEGEVEFVEGLANHEGIAKATAGRDVIGYAADVEIDTRVGGSAQGLYYMSQFALAPLLLELETPERLEHPLILLQFPRPEQIPGYLDANRLREVVSFNRNTVLARKREP